MEQNIKNFDRGIEQMMNEHEVAPPFGMWNRISAELEAMPVAAAAPVATSLIPKRAILGIIATALILGTAAITGYLVSSSQNKVNVNTPSVNTQIASPTVAATTPQQTAPVKNDIAPARPVHTMAMVHQPVAANPVQSTIQAAQQVKPTLNQPTSAEPATITLNNANTDVPTPIEPAVQTAVTETQTYYFPPIDVITPEKSESASDKTITVAKNHTKIGAATADNDDKSSTPSEHKWRIKRHKNGGWGWGKINTTK